MNNEKVEKIKIKVPRSWDDVTVKEYISISQIDKELSNLDQMKNMIFILTQIDKETINKLSLDSAIRIINKFDFLDKGFKLEVKDYIIIDGDKYHFDKNFNGLSVGEMISFEQLATDMELNQSQAIPLTLATLFRKEIKGKKEDFNPQAIMKRIPLFENISINTAYGYWHMFFDWKNKLYGNYSGLFNPNGLQPGDEEFEDEDEKKTLNKKWVWFGIIERLANGDVTKFEEIYDQNYITVLNLLSYWREKEDFIKSQK